MVQAYIYFDVRDGAGFETTIAEFGPRITSADGYRAHSLQRGVENPDRYLLSVKWESVEHHAKWQEKNVREFLASLSPHINGRPDIEHFR